MANRPRGEVSLPEAGEGAYLFCSVDVMERFYSELGENYLSKAMNQIANFTPPSFLKAAIETMMVSGSMEGFPWGLTLDEVKTRALDAISISLNGKEFSVAQEEAQQKEMESIKKKLEEAKDDPKLMMLMFPEIISKLYGNEEAQQALDSMKSEDIPTSTSSDTPTE